MHPFSILTLGIFVAGYITARWDLIAQLYAVTVFAWEHGVVVRTKDLCLMSEVERLMHILSRLEPPKALPSSQCFSSFSSSQLNGWLLEKQNW